MKIAPWLLLCFAGVLSAGQPAGDATPAFGQVAGRIICHDTGQPGRFAGVELLPEQPSATPPFNFANAGQNADFSKMVASAIAIAMKGSNLATVSNLDGSFALDKVPPGTYYLIPQLDGYRSPLSGLSQRQRIRPDQSTLAAVEGEAQKVVVQGGQTAHVTIELDRGAFLSGTISYTDGTPVPGVTPTLLRRGPDGKWIDLGPAGTRPIVTDVHGVFSFSGLPAGQYAVKAVLPTTQALMGIGDAAVSMHMNLNDALAVYSGGALREGDIKPIELTDNSVRDHIRVVFPLRGLRTISGRVLAKSDQHAVNAGMIELQDPDSHSALRTGTLSADGTFTLHYVPEGAYVLKVTVAADMKHDGAGGTGDFPALLNCQQIRAYGAAELPVTVKDDVTGLVLDVPDAPSDQARPALTAGNRLAARCLPTLPMPER